MWHVVDYPQQRRRQAASTCLPLPLSPRDEASAVPSRRVVRGVVRELRRLSAMLRDACAPLRRCVFAAVRTFVQRRLREHVVHQDTIHAQDPVVVRLIGLGIGDFQRCNGKVSLVQMALLLALRSVCEDAVRDVDKLCAMSGTVCVRTSFFDPVAQPFHHACCAALGVEVEAEDRCGAYAVAEEEAALVLYMPHCPWALLHNALAVNWPSTENAALGGALRRVLFVANDPRDAVLRCASGRPGAVREELLACMRIRRIAFDKGAEDDSDDADAAGRQVAWSDEPVLRRAFAAMAVFALDDTLDPTLLERRLHDVALSPPPRRETLLF